MPEWRHSYSSLMRGTPFRHPASMAYYEPSDIRHQASTAAFPRISS
jgi:hypothetical protein